MTSRLILIGKARNFPRAAAQYSQADTTAVISQWFRREVRDEVARSPDSLNIGRLNVPQKCSSRPFFSGDVK